MRSISIYSFKERFIVVPNQKSIEGLTFSQNKFLVSDENIDSPQMKKIIQNGLNEFKILETKYDRNSAASKNFNKDLSKSVGAKSYTEFWKNSQLMLLAEKNEKIIIHASKRALNHKSYQGSFLPPEEFKSSMTEAIAIRIIEIFEQMNE